jgi:hypothetical protein
MALMRARFLTRRGGHGHYEYIQKHPYVPSEEARTKKSKLSGMNNDKLISALQQIKALADAALQRKTSSRAQPAARTAIKPKKSRGANVHLKLQSQYSCELNRVMMALLRLQRRKLLRKTTKMEGKKKQTAYVW